jgi:hypothetical protein
MYAAFLSCQLLDHRLGELAARALFVIEVGRDDRTVLALGLAVEEVLDPGVERLRHRHADLQLDVLELGLAELTPAVVVTAHLVRHHVGLDAAALDRSEQPDFVLTVQLEREVRCCVGSGLSILVGHPRDLGRL